MNKKFNDLLHKYFLDCISDEEFQEFSTMLEEDPELRQKYLEHTMLDAGIRSHSNEGMEFINFEKKKSPLAWIAAVAAMFLIIPAYLIFSQPTRIAVIESSEYAGWESSQSTLPGWN